MGNNVFISYKHNDSNVWPLLGQPATARGYVNEIERLFNNADKFYSRAEDDNDDLSELKDDTIKSILSDLIVQTTVTIILISPNMKDNCKIERDQWIPWEISYSLKEKKRKNGNSHMNAILAVVLPDISGNYEYAIEQYDCHRLIKTDTFFKIIANNMFNRINGETVKCSCGNIVNSGNYSYIPIATWEEFYNNYNYYIKMSLNNRDNSKDFRIVKTIE